MILKFVVTKFYKTKRPLKLLKGLFKLIIQIG